MIRTIAVMSLALISQGALAQDQPVAVAAQALTDAPQLMDMGLYCPVRSDIGESGLDLGNLPNDQNGSVPSSYQIPQAMAREASWIQVFAWIYSGNSPPSVQRIYRFTSEWQSYQPIHYYLYSYGYPQPAISYNSDNFWLPTPASGQIQVSRSGPRWASNWNSSVRITGYLRKNRGDMCRQF